MSKHTHTSDSRRKHYPLIAAFAAVPFLAFSQESAESDDEVFELSPFTVDASEDVGYRAENTLSGSRLNTALKDVPAVIDVSTKELIEDLGVNDFQELMEYQNNTQVHDFEENGAANSGTFNSSMPNARTSYRVRGFAAFNTRDFVSWNSPDDTYNIQRYDVSKGPNGVLFGLGSIGGTTNASTKRAQAHRDFTNVELQYGSWDHRRATIDFNKSIIEDRLGIRVNAVEQDSNGYRNFAFKDVSRFSLAGTFKIAEKTTLYAAFEDGEQDRSSQRPFGPADKFSEYLGEGSAAPTYNNGRANNLANGGVQTRGQNAAIVAMQDGTAYNLIFSPRSTEYNDSANMKNTLPESTYRHNFAGRWLSSDVETYGEYAVSDKVVMEGPDSYNHANWDKTLVTLEHSFSNKWNAELVYFQEDLETYGQNPGGSQVYVDLVENYGDPTSNRPYNTLIADNPHYGDFYMENTWRTNTNVRELEGYRATMSYDLDLVEMVDGKLGKLLGRHRLAALYENREEYHGRNNTFEVLKDGNAAGFPSTNANAEHARNRIIRRNYVTFGDWDTFHTGRFPTDLSVSIPMADGSVQEYETAFVPTGSGAISSDVVTDKAWMVASNSYFFDNRLVLTTGYRVDDVLVDTAGKVRDTVANTGVVDFNGNGVLNEWVLLTDEEYRKEYDLGGLSRSFGGVYHVADRFSIRANHSSGQKLPAVNTLVAPDGDVAPGEYGEAFDYGITFNLMEGKISGHLSRFESKAKNRFIWSNSGAPGAVNQVLQAIQDEDPTNLTDEEVDAHTASFNGGLADTNTEGYEFRVVGNPTNSLKLIFNYSYSQREFANVLIGNYDWMVSESEFYAEKLANLGLDLDSDIIEGWNGDGEPRTTVNDAVNYVLGRVTRDQLLKGLGFGERPHKANFTANYTFKDGRMKGFSIGGSGRWQGKNVIDGVFDWDDTNGNYAIGYNEVDLEEGIGIKEILYGRDTFKADLMMRYRFKNSWFGDNTQVDLQLNIKNLLDDTEVLPVSFINSFEGYNQVRIQEPRSYRLTMRLKF